MGKSSTVEQSTDDQSILLMLLQKAQKEVSEKSIKWFDLQRRIDHIVAQRYLQYLNR